MDTNSADSIRLPLERESARSIGSVTVIASSVTLWKDLTCRCRTLSRRLVRDGGGGEGGREVKGLGD